MQPPVPRSPNAELLRKILLDLQELQGLVHEQVSGIAKAHGRSTQQYKVLTAAGCEPFTVPQIARRMGMTRQGVQKIVNALTEEGLVEPQPNPDHRTSPIVGLTEKGKGLDRAISNALAEAHNRQAQGLSAQELSAAAALMRQLCREFSET